MTKNNEHGNLSCTQRNQLQTSFISLLYQWTLMNLETFKIDLVKQLFNINERSVLMQIKSILDKKEIVAYSTDGNPLTVNEYNQVLKKAEQDILHGRVTNSGELKNEVNAWKSQIFRKKWQYYHIKPG